MPVGRSALRHPLLVVVPVLVGLALGGFVGLSRTPVYTGTAQMSIGRIDLGAPGALAGFSVATQNLASAYSRTIDADAVVRPVAEELRVSAKSLKRSLSASPIAGSPVFIVEAKAGSPRQAVETTNAASASLKRYITKLNRSNPDSQRLFQLFQDAALRYNRLQSATARAAVAYDRVPTSATRRRLNSARAESEGARLRRETLRQAYVTSQQGQSSTSLVQTLSLAQEASSDRSAQLQIFLFAGLLGGVIVGLGTATWWANRRRLARGHTLLAGCLLGAVALGGIAAMLLLGLRWGVNEGSDYAPPIRTARAPAPSDTGRAAKQQQRARRLAEAQQQLFSPTSFWNKRRSAGEAIDPNSAALVAELAAEVGREQQAGNGPWLATGKASTPLYRVGPSQRRVRVRLDAPGIPNAKALQRAFASVPIPANAEPADGTDRHMTIWQPSTDTLWEFWRARQRSDGWHAEWGGAIRRVSKSRGYYTAAAWPGAAPNWGATASSLPVIGGTILARELRAGRIDHALALNVPFARAGVFAWPAQRTDGTGALTTLPEGARLRLDPQLNLRQLKLPRLTRMIATAAQRYGLVVRDQTGQGISLFAEDRAPQGDDPYRRYFKGRTVSEVLGTFPWDRLQVLRMHLCTSAPCRTP